MIIASSPLLKRWKPSSSKPWNLQRVWHLHRRAGFAADWQMLQRDLHDGPDKSIDRIISQLAGEPDDTDFERSSRILCKAATDSNDIARLQAWWLYHLINTPHPLRERLTLTWHNHFATSNVKVSSVGMMRQQNDTLRRHSSSEFSELFRAMAHDPALLTWLDADANRKEHPNENLAREIMELFALGVGHYSESDVREAARALTGWTVHEQKFLNLPEQHDDGVKTIFKRSGNWDGDDLVQMLIEHPAAPRRVATRICETLMGESTRTDELVEALARGLAAHRMDIGWGVETLLRSEVFFAEQNISCRVLSPVETVVSAIRALELTRPQPRTVLVAEAAARLGQELFYPPNVFGWPEGRSWLTSRAIIGRANFAASLVAGRLHRPEQPFSASTLAARHGFTGSTEITDFIRQLLLGMKHESDAAGSINPNDLVASILSSPGFCLG